MASNICSVKIPALDDQISIYGLINRIQLSKDEYDYISEVFLILHVPQNKQDLPNIGRILFQIYSFIFATSDAIIILFNEENEYNQLSLFKTIYSINKSFSFKKNEEMEHEIYSFNDYSFSTREDNYISEDENEDDFNSNMSDFKFELLHKYLMNFVMTESKYVFLLDTEKSKKIEIKSKEKKFKKKIKKILSDTIDLKKYASFNAINASNPQSYKEFLNILFKFVKKQESHKTSFNKGMEYFSLFEMSNLYIKYKKENDYFGQILKKINERRKMIKEATNYENDYQIIIDIQKEMLSVYPLIDIDFNNKVNTILSTFKIQDSKQKNKIISSELKTSSENTLKHLSEIIKNEPYWTKEQISNIQRTHEDFLKEEYLNIIKALYPPEAFIMAYNFNMKIVNDQINHDSKIIQHLFKDFLNNLDKKKAKKVDLQKGTNYMIRERENEREIKVRVEIGGPLEDIIEQDF